MTSAVASLKKLYPEILVDVQTSCMDVWKNNPNITKLNASECEIIEMKYDAIHQLSKRDVSFMDAFCEHLGKKINLPLPLQVKHPCIYLSKEELEPLPQVADILKKRLRYVVCNFGKKDDYTAKWAGAKIFQDLVDLYKDQITFVQIGEAHPRHFHPSIKNVISMVGQTDLRKLFRLVYHSSACVTGISLLHHVAASFGIPCITLYGGREEHTFSAYSSTIPLHVLGLLSCCETQACWRSRSTALYDGDEKNDSLCSFPVISGIDVIPKCLKILAPSLNVEMGKIINSLPPKNELRLNFTGCGTGDNLHYSQLLHLYKVYGYEPIVEIDGHRSSIFEALGIKCKYTRTEKGKQTWGYHSTFNKPIENCDFIGNKIGDNLNLYPLPDLGEKSTVWNELCELNLEDTFDNYKPEQCVLEFVLDLPKPIFLLHLNGNAWNDKKRIDPSVISQLYESLLQTGGTILLSDWNNNTLRIDHPRFKVIPKWDILEMVTLYSKIDLLIGIDSAWLHLANLTRVKALGVFQQLCPFSVMMPRRNKKTKVLCRDYGESMMEAKKDRWNCVSYAGEFASAKEIVDVALQLGD